MATNYNKGRARQIVEDLPGEGTHREYIEWLVKAVLFLLVRYARED